ncbi:MAG: aspartate--ammonia ligase [Lachnospiraceae bacterium]|nr:aspartate--ammonia ligase [Lachnospiraceae bacterium]
MKIPDNYRSALDIKQTQVAIKEVKDHFERALAKHLNLTRVSAPLFVTPESGLNDNLNGIERPVSFDVAETGAKVEIVQSLAKWKRMALGKYGFTPGEGLYADMTAIRRDEETDNLHSIYVDQWDWEKVIEKKDRSFQTLKENADAVYEAMKETEKYISDKYDYIEGQLPDKLTYITTQELEDMYPDLDPKGREREAVMLHGAVFLSQIGGKLRSGKKHDGRAPDYDDWTLNGDIIVYYPVLDISFEVSSMGVRVDEDALMSQLKEAGCEKRKELAFQKALLEKQLPYSIGGGIGQSRICMYFLRKAHIGEVHSSVWPESIREETTKQGIKLL